jgi:hypothetical protein
MLIGNILPKRVKVWASGLAISHHVKDVFRPLEFDFCEAEFPGLFRHLKQVGPSRNSSLATIAAFGLIRA